MPNWKDLTSIQQLHNLIQASNENPVVLFKHSTRCSVSLMAKRTLDHTWNLAPDVYYLDLLNHRDVSNAITETLEVTHQSPQLIVVKDGQAIYHASHGFINVDDVAAVL